MASPAYNTTTEFTHALLANHTYVISAEGTGGVWYVPTTGTPFDKGGLVAENNFVSAVISPNADCTMQVYRGGSIVAQLQDITHRADLSTAPDEFVSTDDDYGTGVNGFRYFDTELANTVASNVVTEGQGASVDGWLDYQPLATNRLTYSYEIENAAWGKIDASVAVTSDTSPVLGLKYRELSISAAYGRAVDTVSCTSGETYVFRSILKAGTLTTCTLRFDLGTAATADVKIEVDLSAGTVAVASGDYPASYGITEIATGVYEVYVSAVADSTAATVYYYPGDIGVATSGNINVAFSSIELGTIPTAVIHTSGDSATRPAMSPAPTISGLVGTEDARLTVKGLAADLVTPDPTDTTERTLDIDNTDGEFDTLPLPIKVLRIDVYNDGERPA